MAMWHKTIYKVKIIPIKILKAFFTIIEKIIPKFAWKLKRLQIGKMTLRKRKIWRYHASEFQTKLQSHSNKNHTCVETQKIPSSQKNLEKEKQSWKYDTLWFQITAGPPKSELCTMDSTNLRLKLFRKKSRKFQKAKLKFAAFWQLFT